MADDELARCRREREEEHRIFEAGLRRHEEDHHGREEAEEPQPLKRYLEMGSAAAFPSSNLFVRPVGRSLTTRGVTACPSSHPVRYVSTQRIASWQGFAANSEETWDRLSDPESAAYSRQAYVDMGRSATGVPRSRGPTTH